jgi:hypothetical protein
MVVPPPVTRNVLLLLPSTATLMVEFTAVKPAFVFGLEPGCV